MMPFFQDLVLKDFWLKLFSFALASLTWITVKIAIKNDISPVASLSLAPAEQVVLRDLPIYVLVPADEAQRFNLSRKTADVTLQGEPAALKNLHRWDLRVMVDLTDGGTSRDTHRRIEVFTPAGLTKVKVDPEEIQLQTNSAK